MGMQFKTDRNIDRKATDLFYRFYRKQFRWNKEGTAFGHYNVWREDARYNSTYIYIHGADGTVVIRLADHTTTEIPVIDRNCTKKLALDLSARVMSAAEIQEFVLANIKPYGLDA